MRNACKNLYLKIEGKGPKHTWDNIEMDVEEIGFEWGGQDFCNSGESPMVGKVMNLWVPWKVINFLSGWGTVKFTRSVLYEFVVLSLQLQMWSYDQNKSLNENLHCSFKIIFALHRGYLYLTFLGYWTEAHHFFHRPQFLSERLRVYKEYCIQVLKELSLESHTKETTTELSYLKTCS